jgi:hypothetical protein
MTDLEYDPKPNYEPHRGRSFMIGAGASVLLIYLVSYFIWFIRMGRITDLPVNVWLEALIPTLIVSLLGGFVGRIAANFPEPKHAALLSGLIFGVFGATTGTAILGLSDYLDSSKMIICIFFVFAAMGAIVGGIVGIANRCRTDPNHPGKWPRFYLSEMLTGFFLMAVIFAFLTALARRPH